jgi:hypothetical protein
LRDLAIGMNVPKIIRILGVSLALVALLTFATLVVSGWHHHDSANEARCPYCHLGHQAAVQAETSQSATVLLAVASLPLPEDFAPAASPVFSLTPSRAPPIA